MSSSKQRMAAAAGRKPLSDVTNSDSPIAGIASKLLLHDSPPPSSSSPFSAGEDLLRSQVNFLIQSTEARETPMFKSIPPPAASPSERTPAFSRGFLINDEDDGTPSPSSSSSTGPSNSIGSGDGSTSDDGTPDDLVSQVDVSKIIKSGICERLCKDSGLGKITIREPVVSGRMITLSDRTITRSLDFDSVIREMEQLMH